VPGLLVFGRLPGSGASALRSLVAWVAVAATVATSWIAAPILDAAPGTPGARAEGCLTCHAGIEDIHPGFPLSCVDCHGGDPKATDVERAHVRPSRPVPNDERVLPERHDLAYLRFVNPSNLRVVREVCGDCHGTIVDRVLKSLHATTSGHLGDGFYEHGLTESKRPHYGVFAAKDEDGVIPDGALAAVEQVPGFDRKGRRDRIETHYADLPRKACMHCHLWSEGRAVDGRLGLDGDYRGEGCAACHVTYADDGRSRSADPSIDHTEPGHPIAHRFTSAIPTDTCTRCHYGDASIGLHFRGLAQLVPGMPAGPDVAGTTDRLQNGVFYIRDADMTPPDVHHQAGMHCIDCHTAADAMGDGNLWPQMDHAVEIECESCHGTIDDVSDLMTSRGRRVQNLQREGDEFFLVSKVTGRRHRVKQARHVVSPGHPDYRPAAAAAMDESHGRLECYTCHSGWNVDFFGFHFDRNEQFTQLDLISGDRTPGRVTTQEKVFATFNQLRLGLNHEGRIAPYMVGFSTLGSARDANGEILLHQATPETTAGLSGITLVPHQVHTTRPEARTCVECHRSPTTYGLGSVNFRLTRELGYALTTDSLLTLAVDTRNLARTQPVAEFDLGGSATAFTVRTDPVHARGTHAYVALDTGELLVLDLATPSSPRIVRKLPLGLVDPRQMLAQGDHLYVADGTGGVTILDIEKPDNPSRSSILPCADARDVELQWPWLVVADGSSGLSVFDVSNPKRPAPISTVDLNGGDARANEALDVELFFQYSRSFAANPEGTRIGRTEARLLACVACGLDGVRIVDLTQPDAPIVLHGATARGAFRFARGDVRGLAVHTVFDIGTEGGGLRSAEHDYLYVLVEEGEDGNRQRRVRTYDISDPVRPRAVPDSSPRVYGGTGALHVLCAYNEPFLQHFVVAAGAGGLGTAIDVSKAPSTGTSVAATWDGVQGLRGLFLEELALDRLQDERGRWSKDISHEDCRYLTPAEMLRTLRAKVPTAAVRTDPYGFLLEERDFPRGKTR
jgi:hypothetical protein